MEQITVRKATLDDLGVLRRFEQGVISAERPFDVTLKADPIQYYDLHQLITASHIELVVAESERVVIGSGYARIQEAKPRHVYEKYAYLGFMYVTPEHRGKGVNKKIIEVLKAWAIASNITEMRLEVYNGNEPAIKAYEKVGFSKHMVEMRIGLNENE